ncbi:hypothetical protein EV361DRAFT_948120 [Lentinula raphanica]|nr:hypothetical protein EV361DRAFT_948120 [Lentinula raphanica]
MSTPSNYTSIQTLPEEQKFNGENYVSFKAIILTTGRLKGLHLYWDGKVTAQKSQPLPQTSMSSTSEMPTPNKLIPITSTAINDSSPTELKYELRESNPDGLGIPHGLSSHELWKYLETEFQEVTMIARSKIAGEGGYAEKMRMLLKEANDCGAKITPTQFNTIFLDSFSRTPTWLIATGNLMGEKSFTVIVSRLEEYFLHMGGGTKSNSVSITPSDRVTALQAKVEQLKAMLSQNRPAHRTPNNPDLSCDNPNC